MALFTVHFPPVAAGQRPPAEKIVFLRDGFSWPAFFFGPFWLAWRRAWFAAALWTLLLVAIAVIAWKLRISRDALSWLTLALGLWFGFEGGRVVAWNLARRGYVERDLVVGDDVEEAEAVFFARWSAPVQAASKESAAGEPRP